MPIRMLRDWTDSEAVDELEFAAEVLFVRLIMKADDYGRFTANPRLVRALCFPLKTAVRETDIARQLAACEKAGLIALYTVANKPLLEILNFGQRLKNSRAKYPARATPDNSGNVPQASRKFPEVPGSSRLNGMESEADSESESEAQSEGACDPKNDQMQETLDAMADRLRMPSGQSSEFREWYAAYPNKVKQGAAWKSYQNAVIEVMRDALQDSMRISEPAAHAILLDAVRRFAASPVGSTPPPCGGRDFRLEAHNWLDNKCWLDPPEKLVSGGNVPFSKNQSKINGPQIGTGSTGNYDDAFNAALAEKAGKVAARSTN